MYTFIFMEEKRHKKGNRINIDNKKRIGSINRQNTTGKQKVT